MRILVLAALAILAGTAHAQLSMTGVGPASRGAAPPLINQRITNTGAFRITNTSANRAVYP